MRFAWCKTSRRGWVSELCVDGWTCPYAARRSTSKQTMCHCLPLEKRLQMQHSCAWGGTFGSWTGRRAVFFSKAKCKKVEVSGKSVFFLPVFPQVCLAIIFRFCFHLEQESFASVAIRNVAWLVCKCEMVVEAALSPVNLGRLPGPISSLKKMSAILQNILKLSF